MDNRYLYGVPNNNPYMSMPLQVSCVDPYVVRTLKSIIGIRVVVETVRGSIQGILKDVKPDHILLQDLSGDSKFYVRIQEIVYVMPDVD